eukprot:gene11255-13097_t
MEVLLDLPMEITRMLVVEWINPIDLVFLDTAYCNNSKRESWLKALRLATHFADYGVSDPDLFELYQNWVFAREVPTRILRIEGNIDMNQLDLYLQKLGDFVEEVTFQGLNEGDFGVFASLVEKYCDNLALLTCSFCVLEATMMTMMNYKSKLRHMRIVDCTDIEPDHNDLAGWEGSDHIQLLSLWLECAESKWFVKSCLKLVDPTIIQQLCIKVDDAVPQGLLVAFFPCCCNLLALRFRSATFNDNYFNSVAQFCANVLHLDISYCMQLTDNIADELVEGMTQLRTLNICGTQLSDVFINILAAHYSHSLQALYASRCWYIEEGFEVLVSNSPLLHTLECSCSDIDEPDTLNNVTTLLLVDDHAPRLMQAMQWVEQHGEHLEHLRVVSNNASIPDFALLTEEALPRLQTVEFCSGDEEEPENLQELRESRPNLHVHYNKNVLAYDMMKLPLHYDP